MQPRDLDHVDIERLLAGSAPRDDRGLRDLAAALDSLRGLRLTPDRVVRARHLAALEVAPARRDGIFPRLAALSLTAKLVLAGTALAATGSGLAAAGALPDAAQKAIAEVAERLGIEIPNPGETDAGPPEPSPRTTPGVLEIIEQRDEFPDGRSFGKAVSEKASEKSLEHRRDDEARAGKPNDAGKSSGKGKSDNAGKPDDPDVPSTGPERAGQPDDPGKPENTGPPDNSLELEAD